MPLTSTREAEAGASIELEATLVYRVPISQGYTIKPCFRKPKTKTKPKTKEPTNQNKQAKCNSKENFE